MINLFIITVIYSIAHGLIMFNDGVFWDGWILYNQSPETIFNLIDQRDGQILRYLMNLPWLINHGITIIRIIIFISFYISTILFYYILKFIKEINDFSRVIIVLLFALFPVNPGRLCIAIGMYGLCYCLYFIGFSLLAMNMNKNKYYIRILSLLTFFLSFNLTTIFVFYLIPLLFIYYINNDGNFSFRKFMYKIIFKYFDFFLLPFITFFIQLIYFKPSGIWNGLYPISLKGIILSPINFIGAFSSSFILPLSNSFNEISYLFLSSLIIYFVFKKRRFNSIKYSWVLLGFGIFAFFISVLPYFVIGRSGFGFGTEWQSRDQLLIPLGASFILFFGLRLILSEFTIRESLQKLMFSFLIGAFTISNCFNYLEFQRDSFKQLSLIANFKNNSIIKNNSSFLFDDQTYALNAIDRWYRFYEYSGLMKLAFGDDNRFGENYKAFINFGGNNTIQDYANATTVPYYNLSNYKLVSPQYKVTIKEGTYKPSLLGTLRTLIYKWTNTIKFESRIGNIVTFEFQKL